MSAGKGDKPRNCFSKKFKDNYSQINWDSNSKDDPERIKLWLDRLKKIKNEN